MSLTEIQHSDNGDSPKSLPTDDGIKSFPPAVYYIFGNEFCERFCFYGMKAILPIYLTAWLAFSEDTSTTIIHAFNFSAYFFTLLGGILADSWLGKFRTILCLSVVYCIGSIVLAVTSYPGIANYPPNPWGCFVGLIILALGTGGIKPCVSSFGGDQFHETQVQTIALFFSVFYFMINIGSVLSMFITPILRSIHGFGQQSCYPLAFGLPAILMLAAIVVFICGRKLYRQVEPHENIVLKVIMAFRCALTNKLWSTETSGSANHWLDLAHPTYDRPFVDDCKSLLRVLVILMPVCLFWALYDQQGSRWTYQALLMSSDIYFFGLKFTIKAEQMGIINAFLILIMIPFFNSIVYPSIEKLGLKLRPLKKMMLGMLLASGSFVSAAILQFMIMSRGTFVNSPEDPKLYICVDGCIHVLAQFPQYVLLTSGEILCSITGLQFAYSQAPISMKSVCGAAWLLTVAAGNLIVIVFNEIDPARRVFGTDNKHLHAWNFLFWSSALLVGTVVLRWLSNGFRYIEDTVYNPQSDNFDSFLSSNDADTSTDNLILNLSTKSLHITDGSQLERIK